VIQLRGSFGFEIDVKRGLCGRELAPCRQFSKRRKYGR
jgi:hypothetical protein